MLRVWQRIRKPLRYVTVLPENGFYTRWDYYYELGCPEIKNMDDILTVCKQMQDNHPTSDSGKPAYAFSLFPDWDRRFHDLCKQVCHHVWLWRNDRICIL